MNLVEIVIFEKLLYYWASYLLYYYKLVKLLYLKNYYKLEKYSEFRAKTLPDQKVQESLRNLKKTHIF